VVWEFRESVSRKCHWSVARWKIKLTSTKVSKGEVDVVWGRTDLRSNAVQITSSISGGCGRLPAIYRVLKLNADCSEGVSLWA